MNGMPGTHTIRTVRIKSKVTAYVTATVKVADDQVREYYDLSPDEEVAWDSVEEYVLEETDESMFELESIDFFDTNTVDLIDTERKHVSPPEFVALPGMEEL